MTLKTYDLKLIKDNGELIYELGHLTITETKSLNGEFYALSTKEVLNVLDTYGVLGMVKKLRINNTKLLEVQGFMCLKTGELNLNCVSKLNLRDHPGKTERWCTLHTLLHEIGHFTGLMVESDADRYADDKIVGCFGNLIKE